MGFGLVWFGGRFEIIRLLDRMDVNIIIRTTIIMISRLNWAVIHIMRLV